jgi:hypothetical protein
MNEVIQVMNQLLTGSRMLNQLITHINKELEMSELILLSELNEQFNSQLSEIQIGVGQTNHRLHQIILNKGMEPRQLMPRRILPDRRK